MWLSSFSSGGNLWIAAACFKSLSFKNTELLSLCACIATVSILHAHLQWASDWCWGVDCHKERVTEMCSSSIILQVNHASWKKLWNIFRKEMEIHHLYVSPPHSDNTFLRCTDTLRPIFSVVMCSRYQHPNILDLLCCFSDEDRYCLLYPYLPNGSLHCRLHTQVPFCHLSTSAGPLRLFVLLFVHLCLWLVYQARAKELLGNTFSVRKQEVNLCAVVLCLQNLTEAFIMKK